MKALTLTIAILLAAAACGDDPPPSNPGTAGGKTVDDAPPRVQGTVRTPDEEPVAGVSVFLRLPYGAGVRGQQGLTTKTDDRGDFAFDVEGTLDPDDAPVELTFRMDGFVTIQNRFKSFRPGRGLRLQVTLAPAGRLRGVVRTQDGSPVADAVVYGIRAEIPGVRRLVQLVHTRSAPDGTFLLEGLPAGKIDVGVKAAGFLTGIVTDVEVVAGREHPVQPMVVLPGKSIAGRVVLADGKGPVKRALVRVFTEPGLKDLRYFGRTGAAKGGGIAKVDEEGRFRVDGLPDGEWEIDALTMGMAPVRPGASGVAAGTEDVELVFVRSTSVMLRVIDGETGEPVTRFNVVIQDLTGPMGPDGRPVITEEIDVRSPVGEYGFPAREGQTYSVETAVAGYEIDQRTVGPLEGGPAKVVKIALTRRE